MQHEQGLRRIATRDEIEAWIAAYERAWRTAGTEPLRDLFAEHATYRMSPYEEPAAGLAAIAQLWERERRSADEPFEMKHEIVAVDGATAVVRIEVEYGEPAPAEYRDLWIVRLDEDGRCREFEEWPFWPGQQISDQEE
ncbi:MAG TPA: nuclear transport factor 2 family protein [Solirubrobacterales bacterium]|nr:nuclear transport factor 2 family protein [Solirubrobacterales bacterium]